MSIILIILNSEELANLVGVSVDIINDLEEGNYEEDCLLILSKIAKVLQGNIQVSFVVV